MKGRMMGGVPYVPGGTIYRAGESYPPVRVPARDFRHQIASLLRETDWEEHGLAPLLIAAALGLLVDGATMFLIAWLLR